MVSSKSINSLKVVSMVIMIRGLLFEFAWTTCDRIKWSSFTITRQALQTMLKLATDRVGIHLRMSNQALVFGDDMTVS